MSNIKKPRNLSLVKIKENEDFKSLKSLGFDKNCYYIFVGEIPNMEGHGIFINRDTKEVYIGFHIDHFREITDYDE